MPDVFRSRVDTTSNRAHHIRVVKVINVHKFGVFSNHYGDRNASTRLTERLRQRFTGVVALDLSSPTKMKSTDYTLSMTLKKCYRNYGKLIFPTPTFTFRTSSNLRTNVRNWKRSPTTTVVVQ